MSMMVSELEASLERFTRGLRMPAGNARNAAAETALAGGLDRAAKYREMREANARSAHPGFSGMNIQDRIAASMGMKG